MFRTYEQAGNSMADQSQAKKELKRRRSAWGLCPLGAIVGLSSGLIAALAGSLLTAVSWLTATGESVSLTRTLGTILLVITIPLLVSGAHCLDLMDRRKESKEASPKETS